MNKIITALAALFIAFFAACTNDYGSGSALTSGEGPIVMPSVDQPVDVVVPEEDEDSEDAE